MSFDRSETESF
jgi:hypothetical protein